MTFEVSISYHPSNSEQTVGLLLLLVFILYGRTTLLAVGLLLWTFAAFAVCQFVIIYQQKQQLSECVVGSLV